MHRSGTSLITSYLSAMGMELGQLLLTGDDNNQPGYFEDEEFMSFQSRLLKAACANGQGGWKDWGYTEDEVFDCNILDQFKEEAEKLVSNKGSIGIDAWKDPRTSLLLDFWSNILPDAKFVLIYRDPWEVISSMKNLNEKIFLDNPSYALKIWKFYNTRILDFKKKNSDKCILVSSNGIIQEPSKLPLLVEKKFEEKTNPSDFSSLYDPALFTAKNTIKEITECKQDASAITLYADLNENADIASQSRFEKKYDQPILSVVIPFFNDRRYILDALASVERLIDQKAVEIIIVNDESTDEASLKILSELRSQYRVIDNVKNQGLAKTRNVGINAAIGKYILPLDSDNKVEPNYIIEAVNYLEKDDKTAVVYSSPRFFGDKKLYNTLPEFTPWRLLSFNFIDACAVYRKDVWTTLGEYDTNMPGHPGYEDWEFWLRCLNAGYGFKALSGYLFEYRVREGSMVTKTNAPENRKLILEYLTEKYNDLYQKHARKVQVFMSEYLSMVEIAHHNKDKELIEQTHIIEDQKDTIDDKIIELDALNKQNSTLSSLVTDLELTLQNIKDSKLYRIKMFLAKLKRIISSPSYIPSSKKGFLGKLKYFVSSNGKKLVRKFFTVIFKNLYLFLEQEKVQIVKENELIHHMGTGKTVGLYQNYVSKYFPKEGDIKQFKVEMQSFEYRPLISIAMPVYNAPLKYLKQAVQSVRVQMYDNWELCIADDCSTDPELKAYLIELNKEDQIKVHFREKNGHISHCSNSALAIAEGEYVALMDQDDLISPDALFQMVKKLNQDQSIDFIYSDEDKVDENNQFLSPHFKPDWSPDNLLCRNYICHFSLLRKSILDEIGGFREGFEGSQDHDLFLRFTEKTDKIHHIPKILYHWRIHEESTAGNSGAKSYTIKASKKAIDEAIKRRGYSGIVNIGNLPGHFTVRYMVKKPGKVSIIIPTKDKADVLSLCLETIFSKTKYPDFEVIVISNNSEEASLFDLLAKFKNQYPDQFDWQEINTPFNFAHLMNEGVKKATGDYYLFLNNDTEIIHEDWITGMVEQAQRDEIGAVGVKLLYPNNTIQHGGVVIGLGGAAGHVFVGDSKDSFGYFGYNVSTNNFSAITGACMMIAKKAFEEVDGFDERFEIEYNDIDLCLRLLETGRNNIYLSHVELYHHESISRGSPFADKVSTARHIKELGMFKDRWKKYIDHDPAYNPNLHLGYHNFRIID